MILQAQIFTPELTELVLRFLINIVVVSIFVRGIYFRLSKEKEYAFAFFLINVIIFFICYVMLKVEISIGFAFGLFAIFGVLRYRTTTIPIKEMTYLFACIALAIVNAVGDWHLTTLLINVALLVFTFLMEKLWFSHGELSTIIKYEKLELLQEDRDLVMQDLVKRTNLNIIRYEVKSYNFVNDSASIKIYYKP